MNYLLVHILPEPARSDLAAIKKEMIRKFDVFDTNDIAPHLTLKYFFEKEHLEKIEKICFEFSKSHKKIPYNLSGLDHFSKKVIFAKVEKSHDLEKAYHELFNKIKKEKVPLDKNEKNGVHLHATLAEDIKLEEYPKITHELSKHKIEYSLDFDNLTILQFDGKDLTLHKMYKIE